MCDPNEIKDKAVQIVELLEDMSPREALTALELAVGTLIRSCWPKRLDEVCIAHAVNVRKLTMDEKDN
jgi:hypothetical protein